MLQKTLILGILLLGFGCNCVRKPIVDPGIDVIKQYFAEAQVDTSSQCWQIVFNMHNPPLMIFMPFDVTPGYMPTLDTIILPDIEYMPVYVEYLMVWFHELGHSTCHKDRCNRNISKAAEEVVAEMIAVSLSRACDLENRDWIDSISYIQDWLVDVNVILSAEEYRAMVECGVDYILGVRQ